MGKLSITVNEIGGVHYLSLDGEFNQYEGEEDIRAINDAYEKMTRDFSQVDLILEFRTERIGTVGINTLTEIYEVVAEKKGRMRFVGFPQAEMKYLEITGFANYVDLLSGLNEL